MSQSVEITLKQLRSLLALEETRHFRRAAEICGVTQPSLSAQIQNLEAVLGLQLVERSRSGVAMTPAGRDVVERARRIVDEAQGIVDFAAGAQKGLSGIIRLGTTPTIGPYLLPQVVAALHRQFKDLNLYVREAAPRDLEFELGKGLHDVILSQLPSKSAEHVEESLFREPLVVALAVDHPLARREAISPDSLAGENVLTLSAHYHLHHQVSALCETFGARLMQDYEGTSLDALRQMVGMGMGITFLPALYVRSEIGARSEVVVRRLQGRTVTRTIGLVWRRSAGRAANYHALAQTIRDVAKKRMKDLIVE
jgi:LysR family hydrogen peroxide-inducible transcriptional activator